MNPLDEFFHLPLDEKVIPSPQQTEYIPLKGSFDTKAYYNSTKSNKSSLKARN